MRESRKSRLLSTFNPDAQLTLCRDERACHFGDFPTLAGVNRDCTPATAQAWLAVQLADLSEFCGCKGKLTDRQIRQTAELIVSENFFLKITEMMLFFTRFKAGRYGLFYGAVDPMTILAALRKFREERMQAIAGEEAAQAIRKATEERKNAMSWEEYAKRNGVKGKSPLEIIRMAFRKTRDKRE